MHHKRHVEAHSVMWWNAPSRLYGAQTHNVAQWYAPGTAGLHLHMCRIRHMQAHTVARQYAPGTDKLHLHVHHKWHIQAHSVMPGYVPSRLYVPFTAHVDAACLYLAHTVARQYAPAYALYGTYVGVTWLCLAHTISRHYASAHRTAVRAHSITWRYVISTWLAAQSNREAPFNDALWCILYTHTLCGIWFLYGVTSYFFKP